jgi:hypothetical protein
VAVLYLLSNDIGIVACFDFEGAVAGPEIDRVCDASNTTLVDLSRISTCGTVLLLHHITISAASVPAIENSSSAYFFQ